MKLKFGNIEEEIITRKDFSLEKAIDFLLNETICVLGYGVQGPGQALNLRDNGFNVIVGQRKNPKPCEKYKPFPSEKYFFIFGHTAICPASDNKNIIIVLFSTPLR
ncbi:ketol-acid reductoisomerase, partial [Candidatus Sulcia muelleri str. Hc (Homalodisca coagulata)]